MSPADQFYLAAILCMAAIVAVIALTAAGTALAVRYISRNDAPPDPIEVAQEFWADFEKWEQEVAR